MKKRVNKERFIKIMMFDSDWFEYSQPVITNAFMVVSDKKWVEENLKAVFDNLLEEYMEHYDDVPQKPFRNPYAVNSGRVIPEIR